MGMDIYFYKIISEEEYKKNEFVYRDGKEFRNYDYSTCNYLKEYGNIKTYIITEDAYDFDKAFKDIGLDSKNYQCYACGCGIVGFKHITNHDIKIDFNDDDMPLYQIKTKYIYTKDVKYIRVGFNNDVYGKLANISDMYGDKPITRERFITFLKIFPALEDIIYNYYKVDKNLDFDLFEISY